jgi:hypothetical protein
MSPLSEREIPAVRCSRPLCFYVPGKHFRFNTAGTCFVIRFRGKLWAVTAKHILTNLAVTLDQVRIPYGEPFNQFLPLAPIAFTAIDYESDTDCTDLLIVEIDENSIEKASFEPKTVYDLDSELEQAVTEGIKVALHGFPVELNHLNEEEDGVEFQRQSISGTLGPRSASTGCWVVNLHGAAGLESHDGFSGSPIFLASSEFGVPTPSRLLGINLRGSAKNLKKQLLDVKAIKGLIDWHLKNGSSFRS